jgi:peptidoglycan/LPS O-acetylase OafA/YrhL
VTVQEQRSYFRPDIEGLRAVAIGAVLLYHAGVPGAEGGFIGVDVFFVISGFLITGLLIREWTSEGRISLLVFYARRFRRLLPAALLAIAATTLASYLVLSSLRFPGVALDAGAAALYVSNLRFAANAIDYLGSEAAPSPLLHFWSLSVEEQYYLFWPLIIMLSLRALARRRLGLVIGAMVVASFGLALLWTDQAAPWAFFSLPTRAWQLGVGALIAMGVLRLPTRTPGLAAAAAVWLGLAIIAAGVVIIDTGTPYPGAAAVIPVLGTALVVMGGSTSSTLPSRLLATRVPRWIGRISYSLYLWHWPILVLVPLALGIDSLALNLGLVAVAIAIAAVSTELIEVPIRQGRLLPLPPRASLAVAGSASLVVALGAVTAGAIVLGPATTPVIAEARPARDGELPAGILRGDVPGDLTPTLAQAYYDLPSGYADGCHLDFGTVEPPACTYGPPDAQVPVVLLGDSHAQQWLPALQRLAEERGWRLRAITKGACPMVEATVWNYPLKRAYRECDAWRERALELIEEEEAELVILASADMYDLVDEQGGLLKDGEGGTAAEAATWDAALVSYLSRVAERAPHVVVLADTPRVGYDPAECLATEARIEACDSGADGMIDEAYRDREAAAARQAGVELLSATEWLCSGPDGACPLVRGPYLVYRDAHHLTATFAAQLASRLGAALDSVTGDDLGRD